MSESARRWLHRIRQIEDISLAVLLMLLLILSVLQIVLRWFDTGFSWIEPVSRMGVLWIAMLGAAAATRYGKHISIDALAQVVPPIGKRVLWSIAQSAAAIVCGFLIWASYLLVQSEIESPMPFIAELPSWVPMLILPIGFSIMGLRFALLAFTGPPAPEHTVVGDR